MLQFILYYVQNITGVGNELRSFAILNHKSIELLKISLKLMSIYFVINSQDVSYSPFSYLSKKILLLSSIRKQTFSDCLLE